MTCALLLSQTAEVAEVLSWWDRGGRAAVQAGVCGAAAAALAALLLDLRGQFRHPLRFLAVVVAGGIVAALLWWWLFGAPAPERLAGFRPGGAGAETNARETFTPGPPAETPPDQPPAIPDDTVVVDFRALHADAGAGYRCTLWGPGETPPARVEAPAADAYLAAILDQLRARGPAAGQERWLDWLPPEREFQSGEGLRLLHYEILEQRAASLGFRPRGPLTP